jgi:hypothetical protein
VICFFFDVDDSLRLPIFSWWDNLANNPGGEVAWFTFFFFGVVLFDKDGAVVMGNCDNDNNGNDGGNDNDDNNGDNDNNTDDAVIGRFVVAASLDLPILTFFVGVTIEGDGLHLLGVLASDGIWFLFLFAMVGWLIRLFFGEIMCCFDVEKNVSWHNLGVSSTWGRENTSLTPNTIPSLTPNTICSASRCQIEY